MYNTEPTSFEEMFNTQTNARDRAEIDSLTKRLTGLYAEFLRRADEFQIDPQPVPHVHTRHDELSHRCAWAAILSTVAGTSIAVLLTAGASSHIVVASVGAILLFIVAELMIDVGLLALPAPAFVAAFFRLFMSVLALFGVALSILLVERFATPELAEVLLNITAYVWWLLETSLLFGGALCIAGWRRFGWSSRIVREYEVSSGRIIHLNLTIDRRLADVKCILPMLIMLLLPGYAVGRAQTIMIDRTGSIEHQTEVEQELIDAVAQADATPRALKVIPFSERVFEAKAYTIRVEQESPAENTWFRPLEAATRKHTVSKLIAQLQSVLRVSLPKARCTCIADMLGRAVRESGPVLLVTDGVQDCALDHHGPKLPFQRKLIVLLARSKYDHGSDLVAFHKHASTIQEYVPNAEILPQFALTSAVADLLHNSGTRASIAYGVNQH